MVPNSFKSYTEGIIQAWIEQPEYIAVFALFMTFASVSMLFTSSITYALAYGFAVSWKDQAANMAWNSIVINFVWLVLVIALGKSMIRAMEKKNKVD